MQDYTALYKRMDKDVRAALWQWIIDHSSVIQATADYSVKFTVSSEDDMWRRVFYRYTGQYERYNKEEKESKRKYSMYSYVKNEHDIWTEKFVKVARSKKLIDKIAVYLYRVTRDYIKSK